MECDIYYAKSKLKSGKQPMVKEHLAAVSELAGQYGVQLEMEAEAKLAGLFHDFGKYSQRFQNVLRGTQQHIDHAFSGAYALNTISKMHPSIIEAVNGHHDGLKSHGELYPFFVENKKTLVRCNSGKTSSLFGEEYGEAVKAFLKDFPQSEWPKLKKVTADYDNLKSMLCTRLLFSCLVDADYSVSASDEDPEYLQRTEQAPFEPGTALDRLIKYRDELKRGSKALPSVNRMRDMLFEQCGKMGELPAGLFTLTAPTGTGKTLALLHFALRHCIAEKKKRIILVLPFLALTEQSAGEYKRIFPDEWVLEDHSQSCLNDAQREYAVRWSAPVIITTSVNFFESLFASKPTDCRKLHRLADSVILFDEAQSLPTELTRSTLCVVNELCEKYHASIVFSTATQPQFQAIPEVSWQPTEIMPNHEELYQTLHRVHVDWRLKTPIALEEVAEEMVKQDNVCAIVNLRRHAKKLFESIKKLGGAEGLFLISTDLCAAHRRTIIEEIKRRQKNGEPVRVVATQCIEAGVDLDFAAIFRALAPLEAIIQAAGRCNRNGRQPNGGTVTVFIPDEEGRLYPEDWYETAAKQVKYLAADHEIDIESPQEIAAYYSLLFRGQREKKELVEAVKNRNYAEVAEQYRLIREHGVQVIVPYKGELELYREVSEIAKNSGITAGLLKKAAPITVTVPYGRQLALLESCAERLNYQLRHRNAEQCQSNVFLLQAQNEKYYTPDMGLCLPEEIEINFIW